MPTRPSRFIALSFFVSALASTQCSAQQQQQTTAYKAPPDCPTPGSVVIRVDQNANVDKGEVTLDKRCFDVAFWVADDKGKNLFIEFDKNGPDPEPFAEMKETPDGKRWRVHCQGKTCSSGEISQAAGGGKRYKYYQRLENPQNPDDKKEVDGWIVIKP
jgi:hypothetical protein